MLDDDDDAVPEIESLAHDHWMNSAVWWLQEHDITSSNQIFERFASVSQEALSAVSARCCFPISQAKRTDKLSGQTIRLGGQMGIGRGLLSDHFRTHLAHSHIRPPIFWLA